MSVETVRCPGCAAAVRPGAAWCSLCYLDLRPKPARVVAPRTAPAASRAPLVAAVPEPATVVLRDEVMDAEVVEDDPPEAGRAAAPASVAAAAPRWPCSCGAFVPMEQSECPVCGSAFLADLAGAANGRHRAGAHGGLRWPAARGPRLALAGLVAAVIAVGLPLLLAVLG